MTEGWWWPAWCVMATKGDVEMHLHKRWWFRFELWLLPRGGGPGRSVPRALCEDETFLALDRWEDMVLRINAWERENG